jgi:hypothetical protein
MVCISVYAHAVIAHVVLQRLQEVDQGLHLLLREIDLKPLVIKVHDLLKTGRDPIMKVRSARRQASQD